ncbi:MAG: hypothetical protein H6926_07800 [Chromatiales bacterium]|nr:hypothetical protein [Chromatiales bacterium]
MLPLLAALPAIFSTVSKVTDLFDAGKKVVQSVTGEPSQASTPHELQQEVSQLPEQQQAQWAQVMQQKIDLYKAQNDRLDLEQGRIDRNITSKLTPEAASKIAVMRQTTRPWAVRMMIHYVFFPWYLIVIDLVQELFNRWILQGLFQAPEGVHVFSTFHYVFGTVVDKGKEAASATAEAAQAIEILTQGATTMSAMYMSSVGWATSIVITYMGLREYSKAKGTSGDTTAPVVPVNPGQDVIESMTGALSSGADLIAKVRKAFKK